MAKKFEPRRTRLLLVERREFRDKTEWLKDYLEQILSWVATIDEDPKIEKEDRKGHGKEGECA